MSCHFKKKEMAFSIKVLPTMAFTLKNAGFGHNSKTTASTKMQILLFHLNFISYNFVFNVFLYQLKKKL